MTPNPVPPPPGDNEGEMFLKLVKTDRIEVEGRFYELRYSERRTLRGGRRYSCEVVLGETDRIIIDDDSLAGLEQRVPHLVPATIFSRLGKARGRTDHPDAGLEH